MAPAPPRKMRVVGTMIVSLTPALSQREREIRSPRGATFTLRPKRQEAVYSANRTVISFAARERISASLREAESLVPGEVSEWLKEHAWKVCIRQRIEGSNPSLSAKYIVTTRLAADFLSLPAKQPPISVALGRANLRQLLRRIKLVSRCERTPLVFAWRSPSSLFL